MSIVELGTQFVAMLFEVTLRSSIVIVSCAILMVLFRSSRAELKHLICRGALYGLLLLPVIQVTAPPFRRASRVLSRAGMGMIPLMATGSKSGMAAPKIMPPVNFSDNKSSENKRSFRWIPLLAGAHLTVTLALLARLGISFLRLSAIIRQGVPIPDRHLRELGHEIWLESLAPFKPSILVSPDVSVPLAVGLSEGFILLPTSWSRWQRDKLRAALVHEMEHVRRHDPATAFLASLVQCFFWMHPLLYWLRRQLTALSEEACDEVVIQCMDPERYCRILIEFASDMTASQGRLVAVSSAVAQRSSIRRRLDRIFSMSSRTRVNGRFAKSLLVGAFLPVLYLTAATRFDQGEIAKTPNAGYLILIQNTERAEEVESDLARDPDNLNMRGALLAFYSNMRENAKFTEHMLWTIEHHPEASSAAMQSYDFPSLQESPVEHATAVANYERVKAAWERALPRHSDSGEVLYHAGLCFEQNDPQRALALFKQARSMTSSDTQAQERYQQAIAVVYASAVTIDLKHGDSRYGINGIAMNAITVRTMLTELENSTDPALFSEVGSMVVQLTNDADSRFGLAFIQRAIDLDPSNSKWGEALESAKAEPIRRRNLGEILRDIRKRDQDNGTAAATIGGSQEEQATASANIVEGVQFSGESKVSEETLRGLIFTKKGEVYNDEAVHRDFVSLWNSGLFSDVHVDKEKGSHGGVLLRFVVVEHP